MFAKIITPIVVLLSLVFGVSGISHAADAKIKVSYSELSALLEGTEFEKRALSVIEKSIENGRNTKAQAVKIKDKLNDENRLYALTYTTKANPLEAVLIIVIKLNNVWYRVSEKLERSSKWTAWTLDNIVEE